LPDPPRVERADLPGGNRLNWVKKDLIQVCIRVSHGADARSILQGDHMRRLTMISVAALISFVAV